MKSKTKWVELLRILKSTVDKEDNADIRDLDFQEKARLICSDPVTCALYFYHRFKELKKTWNNPVDGPFGSHKIKEIYYRIEFQHRGSPHVHMLIWLENAPVYDPDDQSNQLNVSLMKLLQVHQTLKSRKPKKALTKLLCNSFYLVFYSFF